MIQKFPLEIVTAIANHLSLEDTGEFARTCHKCYLAVLPHIWHNLNISDTKELSIVAKKIRTNSLWAQRAIQYVRNVSLSSKINKGFSATLVATLFGITSTHTEQKDEKNELKNDQPHEYFVAFARRILELFPHLGSLVVDFLEAARNFYTTEETNAQLPFTGSFSLVNYKADHTKFLHNLLWPFRKVRHLKVHGLPIVSLCDDIDESILTNNDIMELTILGLIDLERLELSYLDLDVEPETMQNLLQSMPRLQHLELEWIFPPSEQDFRLICDTIRTYGSLYPEHIEKKRNILFVRFSPS